MSFLQDAYFTEKENSPYCYRINFISGVGCYIENIKKVLGFSDTEVLLAVARKSILIKGRGLVIKSYFSGDMQIVGDITSFEEVEN